MSNFAAFPRNKMVEYLTDWVMGTSNQAADDDVKCLTRYRLCSFIWFIICLVAQSPTTSTFYVLFSCCVFMNVSCRDLDQASMEAVVSLLAGLPLQPDEGDGVELMEAKSQLFLK